MNADKVDINRIANAFFEAAKKGLETDLFEFKVGDQFEIPVLENPFGNTAIELSLGMDCSNIDPARLAFKNTSLASILFMNLNGYSIYHDGPILAEAVIEAIN